ncbi:MAG TPA: GAF domain-containing protein [Acidimicrobiia bacterium]|nr:GAF domain-containing protein [Acidimicrobiia bacterium]
MGDERAGSAGLAATDDQLHRLCDAMLSIAAGLSLPVVLHQIVEAACVLVGARYGALGVIGDDQTLVEFITVGAGEEVVEAIGHYPEGRGILGLLITDPRPLRLRDLTAHPASYGFPAAHPPMRSFLGVPVRVGDDVFGNLYLCEKRDAPEFSADDEALIVSLAAMAAVAIDNARSHERLEDLAVLRDRERIARDLHDKVIQRLFATGLSLQAMVQRLDGPVPDQLTHAIDDLDATIAEIRNAIFSLQAGGGGRTNLSASILQLVDEITEPAGLEPAVRIDGPLSSLLTAAIGEELLAVLGEALVNVVRHAAATHVQVSVRADARAVVLRVVDDGGGPPDRGQAGHGLANLAIRARRLGGTCELTAADDETALEWRVPLSE